jgi:hypothetical protein
LGRENRNQEDQNSMVILVVSLVILVFLTAIAFAYRRALGVKMTKMTIKMTMLFW